MSQNKVERVKVVLLKAHSHGGVEYPLETVLSVRVDQAERLKKNGTAKDADKGAMAVNGPQVPDPAEIK